MAAAAAVAILGSGATLSVSPPNGLAQSGGFELVGTHPQASEQPTPRGKKLNFLKNWNGAIYAGYGDYGTNTGPIAITPFAVSSNQFAAQPALWANSEELQVFRVLNGNLVAPSIDPVDRIRPDDYSGTTPAGPWIARDVVDAFHVYDMAASTGSELWMVGSSGDNAVAWRSLDGGVTWGTALTVAPRNIGVGDFARFYFLAIYQGALYVQATDYFGGKHPASKIFNGSEWSNGPDLLPQGGHGYDTELFNGQLVYLSSQSSPTSLLSFNGDQVRSTGRVFHNYSVDGDKLYGLGENGEISKTTNLSSWTELETAAPETARSIIVIDGTIYVGTADSRIYKFSRPSPPPCKGKPATIVGTNGKDVPEGTSGRDVIVGLAGNDKLGGLAGNDLICGGSGKDTLNGGKGNDKLFGEAGKDTLKGGGGKDKLKGGAGKDKQIQ
jgi:RTX calcium-binding nonapeptide repeat (4 copies)